MFYEVPSSVHPAFRILIGFQLSNSKDSQEESFGVYGALILGL